jgi:hypothetical protein
MKLTILLAPTLALLACSESPPEIERLPPDPSDEGCPLLFHQPTITEYHVEISDDEWAAMEDEFYNVVERTMQGLEDEPYHPIGLEAVVDGERTGPLPGVLMRLKGASSWLQTIELDENPKMQFVIAFNEVDPEARFMGVRKVELDMPRSDLTFLQHRVALSYLRESGVPAQCANSARLYINGSYYGLYTHLERLDKEFLQRHYPDADDGDLWKNGRIIKTNEETFEWDRLDALWDVPDMASFAALADVEAAFQEWAAEAMVGDADGYYNGRANFYLYDHPTRGFVWLPHDVDTAMAEDYLPPTAPPIFPPALARWERDWHHYILAMHDAGAIESYVDALHDVRSRYDVGAMQERIELFAGQIWAAAEEDPHRPFSMGDHDWALGQMLEFAPERADYIDAWLACRDSGGADEDGDGFDMCHDCNDLEAEVRPGAPELCNLRDDDCDGHADTVAGVSVCE